MLIKFLLNYNDLMKKQILILTALFILSGAGCSADQFVPDFDNMQIVRCDYEQTIYDGDGSVVSTSRQHRLFRIDDKYQKIYNQREPIDYIINFDDSRIEFNSQSMNDDYISREHSVIDRTAGTFNSDAEITYDNEVYGTRTSKSSGACQILQ